LWNAWLQNVWLQNASHSNKINNRVNNTFNNNKQIDELYTVKAINKNIKIIFEI